MGSIAVVGSINRDLHLRLDALPRPGETVLTDALVTTTGGKGANQAVAVALANATCHMVGAVGDDAAGVAALDTLRAYGVDLGEVHRLSGTSTGTAVVMVDSQGQNSIVVAAAANLALTPKQVTASLRAIPDVTTVLAQCEVPPESVAAAADFARSTGARFILNLAPYRTTDPSILKQCDPLVVNEVEAAALAGDLGLEADDLGTLSLALAQMCHSVVITAGARGACLARGSTSTMIPAPAVDVVDTTGAGDAFVGALTAGLDESGDIDRACRIGVEAGSMAVQHHGSMP
ncbi:ribokinase [Actinopolymorpha alba]|uniref:ribokinase n=1 Tax=Actinopolymorpha alba TaxID=533267 RepID=UPI00037ADA59|nr:ribokinase [Actinopolymorpha alba]